MGCCYSRVEREEVVSRCKARKRYVKQFVEARQAFSAALIMYLRSLRTTGSALLQFANAETNLHHHFQHQNRPLLPSPPTPPPPMSPSSDNWTSSAASSAHPPRPPPPPPPPPMASTWDFWDPFVASSSRSVTEEEWDATTVASEATPVVGVTVTVPPSVVSGFSKETGTELATVILRNSKDLVEIIKELDDYLLKAADAGGQISLILEVPSCNFSNQRTSAKVCNQGRGLSPLSWTWGANLKLITFRKLGEEMVGSEMNCVGGTSSGHCSTVERLYAWEKKLYQEVKNAGTKKIVPTLRKLELKRADYVKTEKIKKEVEKLELRMIVASQAIGTTSTEIIKPRETELYPQLVELVKGLMCMWRSMYECHQVQTHIVQQLKFLNTIPSSQSMSEIHRQSTLQLELEVQQWHTSFCNLVRSHRDDIQSQTGWLQLSLFQFNKYSQSKTRQDSAIYSLCEEWHLAVDRLPEKVAAEGIKSLLTVIHAIIIQQVEKHRKKKGSESAFKELEKRVVELRALECKYGPFSGHEASISGRNRDHVAEKTCKDEEKSKHEKSVGVTRAMILNNLQMGLPHVFQAMTGFSSVCMQAFESVYNQAKSIDLDHDVKRILP
ncbi:protein of unknown function DUF632 [Dillenia turbinata]|uniref:Nitrate regulatory gene2 protein n=1 Tax=Dillenia turbinata TaxID=194707 RepID=A0AAN8Z4Q2_9MAGN